jgi:hypothetical protein
MKNLLFIHIPKTAGTALRTFLESCVDESEIYPNKNDLEQESGRYHHWPLFSQSFRPAQLVRAHLPYSKLLSLYPEKPYVMTILRHPLLRSISEIMHHKRLGSVELTSLSLDEIAQTRPDLFKPQWQYLGNNLAEAMHNLNQCDWVGLQEHYEDGLKMLVRGLGLPMPEHITKVNARPETEVSLSLKSIECILEAVHDDFLLYYHAAQLFRSRQMDNILKINAQGRVGGIEGRKIFGWARSFISDNPVGVDIYLNNVKVGCVVANFYRTDLFKKFNKNCAYEYIFPAEISIFPGDIIRARVAGELVDLENSPVEFQVLK